MFNYYYKFKNMIFLFLIIFGSIITGQSLPKVYDDPGKPFCYPSYPTDQMGMIDNPDGAEITPEGYIYTGYAELMFFAGNPLKPINQRLRTLYKGYLPVFQYDETKGKIKYYFQTFANTPFGEREKDLIVFIRVKAVNLGLRNERAYFSTAFRYSNEDGSYRFRRPRKEKYAGSNWHSGAVFNPNRKYDFGTNAVFSNDSLMLLFPAAFENNSVEIKTESANKNGKLTVAEPAGRVSYIFNLSAGDSLVMDFVLPYRPIPRGDKKIKELRKQTWDENFDEVVSFWESEVEKGMKIFLPEQKVVNTFKSSLIYNLMSLDKRGEDYVQTVNLFHYHAFWLRDASFIVRAYDLTGYHKTAGKCLNFFLKWQKEDGNFLSQGGQFDGWGQALWGFGQHYEMTRDKKFAGKVFPYVKKAVGWFHSAREKDIYKIMPVTRPGDNEEITGHVTGHNFWSLLGLKKAIVLSEALGRQKDMENFRKEYKDYRSKVLNRLDYITKMSGGYIPPGLDDLSGYDWGNLLSVFPCEVLPPWNAKVSATQSMARGKFREGLMTYADQKYLHNYLTTNLTQTSLVRGEQRLVLDDLYSILVHTTATNAGFEYSVFPWKDRDVHHNLTPHGWFAAKYRILLRDILLREEGNDLHLFSAVSPEWLKKGTKIGAKDAPTKFGNVDFYLVPDDTGAVVNINPDFKIEPSEIIIHIPWFVHLKNAVIAGEKYDAANFDSESYPRITFDKIVLAPNTKHLRLNWQVNGITDEYSYKWFVEKYLTEYNFISNYEKGNQ